MAVLDKPKESGQKDGSVHAGHRDRKKQQFLRHGLDAFADHEALELLLFYSIPQQDTNPLAHRLINRFGSLSAVLAAPPEELMQVKGVKASTAVLLSLVPQIYRRARMSLTESEEILDTAERQGRYFLELFTAQSSEVMYQLCLDAKGRKLNVYKVCEGDVGSVGLSVRTIVENALRCKAALVVLAHNHPSGVALPSAADKCATRQVWDALDPIGICLLDHIIVADDDFISMRQSGISPFS